MTHDELKHTSQRRDQIKVSRTVADLRIFRGCQHLSQPIEKTTVTLKSSPACALMSVFLPALACEEALDLRKGKESLQTPDTSWTSAPLVLSRKVPLALGEDDDGSPFVLSTTSGHQCIPSETVTGNASCGDVGIRCLGRARGAYL